MTEEQIRKIQKFQLTSDIFFGKVLEDKLACQEVVEIITGKKTNIKEVKSQYSIRQLLTHSIIIDIEAVTETGTTVHLEMHPQKNEDHRRRMRYNAACIDVENLEKGEAYKKLPDVYGIYFSTKNFESTKKKRKKPIGIYKIIRSFQNIDEENPNGIYEYYVNLYGQCDTKE